MDPARFPRHFAVYAGALIGLAAGVAAAFLAPALALSVGVNVFFFVYMGFMLASVAHKNPAFLRKHAVEEDAPAAILLLGMVGAVVVSAITLFVALAGDRGSVLPLILAVSSVVLGWFAVHMMWAMHYAYEYYDVAEPGGPDIEGGLSFPGGDDPDGTAFLYFAYVIGMTAQTSDTEITSNAMRRLVTIHGLFSFFFNTVLVAAAVNIAVSFAS